MKISPNRKIEGTWNTQDTVNLYEYKLVYKLNLSEKQKENTLIFLTKK